MCGSVGPPDLSVSKRGRGGAMYTVPPPSPPEMCKILLQQVKTKIPMYERVGLSKGIDSPPLRPMAPLIHILSNFFITFIFLSLSIYYSLKFYISFQSKY